MVVDEINQSNGTDYQADTVYFEFTHEVMSNEQENAQIDLTEAQTKQTVVNTLLSLANTIDDETIIRKICECLDIDYDEISDKLPVDEAAEVDDAAKNAAGIVPEEDPVDDPEGGAGGEV